MDFYFCMSVRFLDPEPHFHGRRDGGTPEWPPSPLRIFQSLVAAAARRFPRAIPKDVEASLRWLEDRPPPIIIAPRARISQQGYQLSVPNNAMDLVATAWARGNYSGTGDADPRTHRTMKQVRPLLMKEGGDLHYLWASSDEDSQNCDTLCSVARSLVSLGWGIDLVIGHGGRVPKEGAEAIPGEYWLPCTEGLADGLRVPKHGTLSSLYERHNGFLLRLGSNGFVAPPPLTCFRTFEYRRAADLPPPATGYFSFQKPDGSGFRAFDPVRHGLSVAGMLRHVTKSAAQSSGWDKSKIDHFVLGHGSDPRGPRLLYVPLPTLERRKDGTVRGGAIRRCLLTVAEGPGQTELVLLRKHLQGAELIDEHRKEVVAVLSELPGNDTVVKSYVGRAHTWSSVTPVILPGYDDPDHLRRKAEKQGIDAERRKQLIERVLVRTELLLRRALIHSGFSKVLAMNAEIEWGKVGLVPGVDLASRYGVPDHLRRYPRVHARIRFRDSSGTPVNVPGPLCIGAGRYYGLGLFVGYPN